MFVEESGLENIFQVDDNFISTLLDGLTVGNLLNGDILEAVDRLANLSAEEKKSVVAKTCYFFYASECDNFSQLSNEDSNTYVSRVCQLIATKIRTNLLEISEEENQKNTNQRHIQDHAKTFVNSFPSSPALMPAITMRSPGSPLWNSSPVKFRAAGLLGGGAPVHFIAQPLAFNSWSNFPSGNANGVTSGSPMKASLPLPSNTSARRSVLLTRTQQYQQWFVQLSEGEFSAAMTVENKLAENHIALNYMLTDEFGKSPGNYACDHVDRLIGVLVGQSNVTDKLNSLLPLLKELSCIKNRFFSLQQTGDVQQLFWQHTKNFDEQLIVFCCNEISGVASDNIALFRQAFVLNGHGNLFDAAVRKHDELLADDGVSSAVNPNLISELLEQHKVLVDSGMANPPSVFHLLMVSPFQKPAHASAVNSSPVILSNSVSIRGDSTSFVERLLADIHLAAAGSPTSAVSSGNQPGTASHLGGEGDAMPVPTGVAAGGGEDHRDELLAQQGAGVHIHTPTPSPEPVVHGGDEAAQQFIPVQLAGFFDAAATGLVAASAVVPVPQLPTDTEGGEDDTIVEQAPTPPVVVLVGGAPGGDTETAVPAVVPVPQSPASALTSSQASTFSSPNSVSRHRTPKVNLLTADITAEQGALEIDKSVVVNLLSDGGFYASNRNEGFWFYRSKKNSPVSPLGKMGASGSDTIKNLRALISGEDSDGKISLAAVRSAITFLSVRKDFVNHHDSCGTTRVLKEINKAFNKVANATRAQVTAAVV
jgi:hypothetical protein